MRGRAPGGVAQVGRFGADVRCSAHRIATRRSRASLVEGVRTAGRHGRLSLYGSGPNTRVDPLGNEPQDIDVATIDDTISATMKLDCIHNVDCVQGLRSLPPESIDLVFADPPFNIGYDYDVYDDRRACDDYLEWSRAWIDGVIRALKPNGTFWLAIGDEYAAELKVLCARDLGLHCRNWVVWFYTFGVHCRHKFTRSHAHLFYFVKDPKDFTFNSLDVRVPSARELVYGDKRADRDGRVPDDTWMIAPVLPPEVPTCDGFVLRPQDIPERFPPGSDTWLFSRVAGTFGERRGWHGCQMPEQLLGRIVRACSNEGDVVLDPFGGSGTTLAVAKKLNRRYIGFELSAEYARRIAQRLADVRPGDALVGPENAATSSPRTSAGRRLQRAERPTTASHSQSPAASNANGSLSRVALTDAELGTDAGYLPGESASLWIERD